MHVFFFLPKKKKWGRGIVLVGVWDLFTLGRHTNFWHVLPESHFFFLGGGGAQCPPATPHPVLYAYDCSPTWLTSLLVSKQKKSSLLRGGGGRCTTICLKIHNRVKTYLKGGHVPPFTHPPPGSANESVSVRR